MGGLHHRTGRVESVDFEDGKGKECSSASQEAEEIMIYEEQRRMSKLLTYFCIVPRRVISRSPCLLQ
jgi:hypothetical protein